MLILKTIKSMKQLILLCTLCLFQTITFGQSIKIKKGTATVDKSPYCLVETDRKIFPNYTIKALDGTELFFVRREVIPIAKETYGIFYVITVLTTEEVFEIDQQYKMGNFLIKAFYNNGVIKNNAIDESGLAKFKLKYKGEFRAKAEKAAQNQPNIVVVNEDNNNADELTERDRNGNILIIGQTIKQDFVVIGTYKKTTTTKEAAIYDIFKIYNTNGKLIAQIDKKQFAKSATYVTLKDNEKRTIAVTKLLDNDLIESVVEVLIEYLYL